MKKIYIVFISNIFILFMHQSCTNQNKSAKNSEPTYVLETNKVSNNENILRIDFYKGKEHNHPLMAIWAEDTTGKYLETFYVAQSIAKGTYEHGTGGGGKWMPGPVRRPATLPYWAHKRNVLEKDGLYIPTPETAIPDAISGATPKGNFSMITKSSQEKFPRVFNLMLEINQSWDWNEYWTNNKFPDDKEYKTSSQPSIIYQARVSLDIKASSIELKPIGHGHYAGKTGELFTDLTTITTALKIVDKIIVKVGE